MPDHLPLQDIPSSAPSMIFVEMRGSSPGTPNVTIAVEIARAVLVAYRRLFEQLIAAADER